ncbi:MAG: 2-phospho-L-lactate transferase [Dehalococcoidia bacterium]|nr:2-phospho-L-lactate transferase [Dehalococcoidia bacterium]
MSTTATHALLLAGGGGGAKLAEGFAKALPPDALTIVVNTGDDEEFHGLHVSPDLDTVMYALAGLINPETGWGVKGDTLAALEMLERLGAPTWFRLGDRDLAVHVRRTQLLRQGWTLSKVTRELCARLGVRHQVVPMSDGPVRTRLITDAGELAFQEYFVRRRSEPRIRGVRYEGASAAMPSEAFLKALERANVLVFGPSNPVLSVGPVLALSGVRERIASFQGCRVAISPIIGGKTLKGPAAKNLTDLGEEPTAVGVARRYQGLCDIFVLDTEDLALARRVAALGFRVEVMPTVMATEEEKVALARRIFQMAGVG